VFVKNKTKIMCKCAKRGCWCTSFRGFFIHRL